MGLFDDERLTRLTAQAVLGAKLGAAPVSLARLWCYRRDGTLPVALVLGAAGVYPRGGLPAGTKQPRLDALVGWCESVV